jgi:dienelactone hydrolase
VRIRDSRFIESGLRPFELTFRVETPRSGTAEASILRRPIAEGVERREIRESGVVGTLFTPAGAGPHPAIAVVPGSNGGIPEALGALYASHGYAALALGYFRVGDLLPETLEEIPLEYFDNAFNWLSDQPLVDANRLVVSGASRGGELALLLGATFPTVRGVLAWVPSNTVNQGFARIGDDTVRAAWTLNGEPIPFLPRGFSDPDHPVPLRDGGAVFAIGALRSRSLIDDPEPYEIPVERINGPVLFLSGRDDVLWPSAIFSDWAVSRLREKGFAHEVQHLSYENAGHTLGPANGPATVIIGPDAGRVSERFTNLGGTPEGIARARADLWPRVLEFLGRTVATA